MNCYECKTKISVHDKFCQNCGTVVVPNPKLAILLVYLSILSLLGGLFLCVIFWPGSPGDGYKWKAIAYTASIAWLVAGIFQAALIAAFANILIYLNRIEINTRKKPK